MRGNLCCTLPGMNVEVASQVPDRIRWGIMGTGWIAGQFAEGLADLPDAELIAVGSRTAEAAGRFADRFGVPRRHANYEALAEDPGVDVVYVATPNTFHKRDSLLCLEAGKPVLCEKPFTINAGEAATVIKAARNGNLFLMEAMWTRFLPAIERLRVLLAEGVIGDLHMLVADLGMRFDFDPQSRLYDPHLGGGALLDLGIYPVSMASMLFGAPSRITSTAQIGVTGVDEQAAIIFEYGPRQLATLHTSLLTETPQEAILQGSRARIRVEGPIYRPSRLVLSVAGLEDRVFEVPYRGNGYTHEAAEVMRCLRAGELESRVMSLNETLSIMRTMDEIRGQWGLRFPME